MSLLKRIEQGQTKPTDPSLPQKPGASVPPAGAQADQGGVLGGLQARRAPATSTSPQPGSYFDLKPGFKIVCWPNWIHPWTSPGLRMSVGRSWICLNKF